MHKWLGFIVSFFTSGVAFGCGMTVAPPTQPADFMIFGVAGAAITLLVMRDHLPETSSGHQLLVILSYAILGLFAGSILANGQKLEWDGYATLSLILFGLLTLGIFTRPKGWKERTSMGAILVLSMIASAALMSDRERAERHEVQYQPVIEYHQVVF